MACNSTAADNGIANINLTGTPFSVDDAFTPVGAESGEFGGASFSAGNQVVDISGNGFCGWRTPYPEGTFYVFNPDPDTEQYGLQLTMEAVAIATPSLIRAISGPGNTALLIGRIDGAPGPRSPSRPRRPRSARMAPSRRRSPQPAPRYRSPQTRRVTSASRSRVSCRVTTSPRALPHRPRRTCRRASSAPATMTTGPRRLSSAPPT